MELTEQQNAFINRVAKDNGFRDYEVITNPGSFKGDNFLGILTAVTIKNSEKTLELILKTAHTNEAFRKEAPLKEAYEREIHLYRHIFQEFKTFQEEYNIKDPFNSVPKAYALCDEDGHEFLILENLKTQGYQLWDKKSPMNSGHIKAVLKEYAKFHAVSLAMKENNPEQYNKLVEKVNINTFDNTELVAKEEKLKMYIAATMSTPYEVVKDDPVFTKCLQTVQSELPILFKKDLKEEEYKLVVTHGDCWCNNLLFKYEDSTNQEKPSSIRILDWQISSLGSPAYDFCYFFLVHSTAETLNDYKTYLKFYYDTLSNQLRNFNCDPDKVFSYSRLEAHLKKFMKFGLFLSFMVLKIMLCDSEEAPDLAEMSEREGGIIEGINFKVKNLEGYKQRFLAIMRFLKNNNFI